MSLWLKISITNIFFGFYYFCRLILQTVNLSHGDTAQKMKFSIQDFFRKCDQIHRKLRIWSHLLKKS